MNGQGARFNVSGLVQGVAFRAYTRAQARQLGLRGFARNLPDGSVEVLAAGDPAALAALEQWLWQGSPAAQVDAVRREDAAVPAGLHDFGIA